jgi:hypothetical protein
VTAPGSVVLPGPTPLIAPVSSNTPTGVEVTLHPRDQTGDLIKLFLLGPV